jgi:hypothetical protein
MPDKGWRRQFDDPIPLPRGRQLVTLKNAANYIMKLLKADQARPRMADGDRGMPQRANVN